MFRIDAKIAVIVLVWLAVGWLFGYLPPLDESLGTLLPAWVRIPGVAAILAGGTGVLLCGMMLNTCGIGTRQGRERLLPEKFLVSGPFALTRNPMSLAAAVLIVGLALWHQSGLALGFSAAFILLLYLVIVYVEEPALESRFGESYQEYRRHVPRWIPRMTAWTGRRDESGAASG